MADNSIQEGTDVFISYSRVDQEWVRWLNLAFQENQREPWVDWAGIQPGEEWWPSILGGIEGADAFVFVLSPDSIRSEVCRKELEHAVDSGKRIVPVICRSIEGESVHPELSKRNYIWIREPDEQEEGLKNLFAALDTDLEHVRAHTKFLIRAREWETKNRKSPFLLRGGMLKEADHWLSHVAGRRPDPTDLHAEYIVASRSAARKRQWMIFGSLGTAAVVTFCLAVVAVFALSQANKQKAIAETQRDLAIERRDEVIQVARVLNTDLRRVVRDYVPQSEQLQITQAIGKLFGSIDREDETAQGAFEKAVSLLHQAKLLESRGGDSLEEAEALSEEVEELLTTLEDSEVVLGERATGYSIRGDVRLRLKDFDQARDHYQTSLELRQAAAELNPDNDVRQRNVTVSLGKLGKLDLAEGKLSDALARFHQSLEIRKQLHEQYADHKGLQRDLSVSYMQYGDVLIELGSYDGGAHHYREALKHGKALQQKDQSNLLFLNDVFVAQLKLGDLLFRKGDVEEAVIILKEARASGALLVERDPGHWDYRHNLGIACKKLGDHYSTLGELESPLVIEYWSQFVREFEVIEKEGLLSSDNQSLKKDYEEKLKALISP